MADKTNTQAAAKNGLSKTEAVRRALEKLGRKAKPSQLKPYIKSTFGIDITPGHTPNNKSTPKAKKKRKPPPPNPKEPAPQAKPAAKAPPAPPPLKERGIDFEDLRTVKTLLG